MQFFTDVTTVQLYFDIVFILSALLTLVYGFGWRKHFDAHITLVFVIIPVANLGFALRAHATNLQEALAMNKICYLGGCFLELAVMLAIFSLCGIKLPFIVKALFFFLSAGTYLGALTVGQNKMFYTKVALETIGGSPVLIREYGWMHTAFQAMVILFLAVSVGAILYCLVRKTQISRKILVLLLLPEVVAIFAFFVRVELLPGLELVPAAYVVAQITYLLIAAKIPLYDVTESAIEALVRCGAFSDLDSNRLKLFNNLDFAMKRAARIAKDKASGQMDMFAVLDPKSVDGSDDSLKDFPPQQPSEDFRAERELCGIYLTGHPLGAYGRITGDLATMRLDAAAAATGKNKVPARIVCMLSSCAIRVPKPDPDKPDKNLNPWALLKIDDGSAAMEAFAFSRTFEKCNWLPQMVDKPLLVCGEFSRRTSQGAKPGEGELQFIVRECYPLEKGAGQVFIEEPLAVSKRSARSPTRTPARCRSGRASSTRGTTWKSTFRGASRPTPRSWRNSTGWGSPASRST